MSEKDIIAQELDKIYSTSPKPVYISRVGQQLRSRGCAVAGSLRKYIEDNIPRYTVLQHPEIKEKIVISSASDLEMTKGLLQSGFPGAEANGIDKLLRLPRSFLIPFCKSDKDVLLFVNVKFPFKYTTGGAPEGDGVYHPIDAKYRADIILPQNLKKLDKAKLEQLWTNISEWSNLLGVDLDSIHKSYWESEAHHIASPADKAVSKTALERLIEAQPTHIRGSFVIPMDIISLLNKH